MKEYNPKQELADGLVELHALAIQAALDYEAMVDAGAPEEELNEAREAIDAIQADLLMVRKSLEDLASRAKYRKN